MLPPFESCLQMHACVIILDWRSAIKYYSIINVYHLPLMLDFLCYVSFPAVPINKNTKSLFSDCLPGLNLCLLVLPPIVKDMRYTVLYEIHVHYYFLNKSRKYTF